MRNLFWILVAFTMSPGFSQESECDSVENQKYKWQEQVLIQTNHNFFITGEILRFNLICLLPDRTTSAISKVAYVELIDENEKSVLQQKIKLVDGIGNGDFYLPSILKSGNYNLIAYTQWMRNFSTEKIAQSKLSVINPFRPLSMEARNDTSEIEIKFYPESGSAAIGVPNLWIYQITQPDIRSIKSFKIISEHGDVVYSQSVVDSPIGRFEWVPTDTSLYRAILIDSNQNLRYCNIEIPNSNSLIHLSKKGSTLLITIFSSGNVLPTLKIDGQKNHITPGASSIEIQETTLLPGRHLIQMESNGIVIAQRPFFIRPKDQKIVVKLKKKELGIRSLNSISIASPVEPSNVLIAIRRKDIFNDVNLAIQDIYFGDAGFTVKKEYFESEEGMEMLDNLLIINQNTKNERNNGPLFLPEMRGPTVLGILRYEDETPVPFRIVHLCLPTRGPQLFLARTNSNGIFDIVLQGVYGIQDGLFSFNGEDEKIEIDIRSNYLSDYSFVTNTHLQIPKKWLEPIRKQSIEVQLHNAYFKYNSDSINKPQIPGIFYGNPTKSYRMEDYTQLPTVKDIIREYIPEVNVKQTGGKIRIGTTFISDINNLEDSTLLLLNGIPISDPEIVLNIHPSKIEKIDIINKNYIFGPIKARGIIHVQTNELKMDDIGYIANVQPLKIEGVQVSKELFSPDYSNKDNVESRIPDLRRELYWNPFQKITNEPIEISFYTSDLEGEYEIIISGQTQSGAIIDERISFFVKN